MDDARIWSFEESLWTGDADHYRESIDAECVMVVPAEPHVMTGEQAIAAVSETPRWAQVTLSDRQVMRPQEGLIVIGYKAVASRGDGEAYTAWCTSTYRRLAHEEWRVVQHQQTVPPVA
ncbi:DUF4440 domain-containing protein [Sphingomonas sp. CJ99]